MFCAWDRFRFQICFPARCSESFIPIRNVNVFTKSEKPKAAALLANVVEFTCFGDYVVTHHLGVAVLPSHPPAFFGSKPPQLLSNFSSPGDSRPPPLLVQAIFWTADRN